MCSGPFEDTQFDAVVDVETSSDENMDTGTYFHLPPTVTTRYYCQIINVFSSRDAKYDVLQESLKV